MPEISRFYGLIVLMNFKDHNPPHFHVWYGDFKAIVTIEDGIVKGEMPQRALKMIFEWLEIHREELIADWHLAQKGDELFKIEPLIPLRLPYFPQLIENWIFSELDRLFCNIAFKIDFIAK